jgi:hypothetical protein
VSLPDEYSIKFNGTSDYLTVATSSAYDYLGDYTIECWVYLNASTSTDVTVFGQETNALPKLGINGLTPQVVNPTIAVLASSTIPLTLNTWYHLALVRNGLATNNIQLYVNGALGATATQQTIKASAVDPTIGGRNSANTYLNGYISNLRVIMGQCLYFGTFTPPTSKLTATTVGTSGANVAASLTSPVTLLIGNSNTLLNQGSATSRITSAGTAKPARFSPFQGSPATTTSSYSLSKFGGSVFCDGTGDYLSIASKSVFGYGTRDLTIELWIYTTSSGQNIYDQRTGADTAVAPCLYTTSGVLYYYTAGANRITGPTLGLNQWYHLALSRVAGSTRLFVNGSQVGSTYADSNAYITSPIVIGGRYNNVTPWFAGYISDVKIEVGSGLYSANFLPNSIPNTSTGNTILQIPCVGAVVDRTRTMSTGELIGSGPPTLSNAITKYNPTSIYLGGKLSYTTVANPQLVLGTGDFTFECWIYWVSTNYNGGVVSIASTQQGQGIDIHAYLTTGYIYFAGNVYSIGTLPIGSWDHYAIVRKNGVTKFYFNGVFNTTIGAVTDASNYDTGFLQLGYYQALRGCDAYIDDFRITKNYARYDGNFTAPATSYKDK